MPSLSDIVQEVDRRAPEHAIGALQDHRKFLRGLGRRPTRNVFDYANSSDWAFHVGGRDELQFNLGIEEPLDGLDLRYGVAFSLELSRSLASIDPLLPRVAAFNDYVREHAEDLAGLSMWHYDADGRSAPRRPVPIGPDLARVGVFVFLGRRGSSAEPDYDDVLATLDRLMPLWLHIEEGLSAVRSTSAIPPQGWPITPGLPHRVRAAVMTTAERALAMDLRHVGLQEALYHELVAEHGHEAVGVEQPAPGGGSIDVVAQTPAGRVLFEIKTASTARGCIREALGQLLDYALWTPHAVAALCVIGEPALDAGSRAYLAQLNRRFPFPLTYRSVALP